MSTAKNDINTAAEMLFAVPERLKQLTRKYDRIKSKHNV
jgi:hypothetical protein